MAILTEVQLPALAPERFRSIIGERFAEIEPDIARAREELVGRVVWHVNSTARGGGVAEMLRSYLAYARGSGVDVRWVVVGGDPAFFQVTKRIHNNLHGDPGDGGELGRAQADAYEKTLDGAAAELAKRVKAGDVVFLHDPQTAGLISRIRADGAAAVWRCHVGIDEGNALVHRAWDFLRPYLAEADAVVFSRSEFVWEGLEDKQIWIMPPTIDAFSPKNQEMEPETVAAVLDTIGLAPDGSGAAPTFTRDDGTTARVGRQATIVQEESLPAVAPVLAQVSRWDRLKDPLGVLRCFAERLDRADAHLVLAGPDVDAVDDDPEGREVLGEVRSAYTALPDDSRRRAHLVSLPMDDLDENAAMVNALQRRADVVLQKSIAEGFGLTVAEAMWKSRPVVAGRVGGIQDQIVDGESGVLVDDPRDLPAVAAAVDGLMGDPQQAEEIGRAARRRVTEDFLQINRLREYFEHVLGVLPPLAR
ncbi:MAG: glycosyltransferase [Solirubrobacterales bacterium]